MKVKTLLILLIPAIFLSSCEKDEDDGNTNPGTFDCTFLQVGNKWTFDYTQLFTSGTMITEIKSMSNGEYLVHQTFNAGTPNVQRWFTNGDMLYSYVDGESKSNAGAIFKCGASVGDQWEAPSTSQPGEKVYYKVVELNSPVTTTFGSFSCVKIEVTFSYAINTQYNYWTETDGLVFQTGFFSLNLRDKNF